MGEEELRLADRFDTIRSRWKLLVAVALPIFIGATVYAERMPAQYTGSAILSIEPRSEGGLQGLGGAELVRVEAPKFVAYVTAPATVQTVARRLGMDPDALQESTDANVPTDTGQMTINVTASQPEEAAAAANEFADQAIAFSQSDPLLRVVPVANAVVARSPSGPPRRLIEAAALIVAILTSLVVVFAAERMRPTIRTGADVAEWTSHPVVGMLPTAREPATSDGHVTLGGDAVSSSFRTLVTNLRAGIGKRVEGTFVVTSSMSGEGKTFVATGLATVLSDLGGRVLLVDADTHRGSSNSHGEEGGAELVGLLRGEQDFERCLRPGWVEGLSILPTATDPEGATLIARGIESVLAQARAGFDVVIVDSPPVLGSDETGNMATLVDGVVFVVSAGTPASTMVSGISALEAAQQAFFAGIVVNRARRHVDAAAYYRRVDTRFEGLHDDVEVPPNGSRNGP